jgi:hypothetical protein
MKTSFCRTLLPSIAVAGLLVCAKPANADATCAAAAAQLARDNGVHVGATPAEPERLPEGTQAAKPASPPISAETRARLQTLLDQAEKAADESRPAECDQHLRQAQLLLPPG